MNSDKEIVFLQWALPKMGYRWKGFRKPRGQVLKRVRERIGELGLTGGCGDYRRYLEEHPEEWNVLDRLCDVTISKFFRDRKLWEYLKDTVLPELIARNGSGPVATWSIGCCNGEEAYSLAMLSERLHIDDRLFILASDRNPSVLERAQLGRYPAGTLKELTKEEKETSFHPVPGRGGAEDYEIEERLKRAVTFERRDIRDSMPDKTFDLVLCRNLAFTYFDRAGQERFLERLNPHLVDGGYLVIGVNEGIPPDIEWLERSGPMHPVFKKCRGMSGEC